MDERELTELFRDAPGEPPEPSFSLHDVTSAARRDSRRRRAVTGVAVAVALVAGGGGALGAVLSGNPMDTAVTAQAPAHSPAPGVEERSGNGQGDLPGAVGSEQVSPRVGDPTAGCAHVDSRLAGALARELDMSPAGAAAAPLCGPGVRGAAFKVAGGRVSAMVVPGDAAVQPASQPEGTAVAERGTAGGGTVLVVSNPAPGSTAAPLAGEVDRIAAALAAQF